MNSMVRERESHVSRLFIEVTPGIRRALELLGEASITLLDEIDTPVEDLEDEGGDEPSLGWVSTERGVTRSEGTDDREIDDDFEVLNEDDEDGGDDEAEPFEPDLGWTEDGQIGGPDDWTGSGSDDDFADPETSAGFPRGEQLPYEKRAEQEALFDPRIARRGPQDRFSIEILPDGRRLRIEGGGTLPRFPHDPPGRVAFHVGEEIRRLNAVLWTRRRRRKGKRA